MILAEYVNIILNADGHKFVEKIIIQKKITIPIYYTND